MYLYHLVIVCLYSTFTSGKDCPEDADLKKILQGAVMDVELKQLQGTWMVTEIPKSAAENEDFLASYNILEIDDKNEDTITVSAKDFMKDNTEMYFEEIKKKKDGSKGVFEWGGQYESGMSYTRNAYIFHVDDNVLGVYSCDPEETLEEGWACTIFVNGKKKTEMQATSENDVKKSLKVALDKLSDIKTKGEKWGKKHGGKFGLVGEMGQVDLSNLRP